MDNIRVALNYLNNSKNFAAESSISNLKILLKTAINSFNELYKEFLIEISKTLSIDQLFNKGFLIKFR